MSLACVCSAYIMQTFASVDGLLRKLALGIEGKGQGHVTWEQFLAFFSCAANKPEMNEVYDR